MEHTRFAYLLFGVVFFLASQETLGKTYPVDGSLAGIPVQTTVDSITVQQMISGAGIALTGDELRRFESVSNCSSLEEIPPTDTLEHISQEYSTDTATALLIQCLHSVPIIKKTNALFSLELERYRNNNSEQAAFISSRKNEYMVLFIPGWGYQTNGKKTGSDLAIPHNIVSEFGFESYVLPIEEDGSVEQNAYIIVKLINDYLSANKKIILVSASSGGPSVALALGDPTLAGSQQVVGWLNICGVLNGTPVIDNLFRWPKSWLSRSVAFFKGWEVGNIKSLSRKVSLTRFEGFQPKPYLTVVNYIGIPFSGQISEFGKDFYEMIKDLGPNDGLTLITDALVPGYTVTNIGGDHFIREDPNIDDKTAALIPLVLKLIEQPDL